MTPRPPRVTLSPFFTVFLISGLPLPVKIPLSLENSFTPRKNSLPLENSSSHTKPLYHRKAPLPLENSFTPLKKLHYPWKTLLAQKTPLLSEISGKLPYYWKSPLPLENSARYTLCKMSHLGRAGCQNPENIEYTLYTLVIILIFTKSYSWELECIFLLSSWSLPESSSS